MTDAPTSATLWIIVASATLTVMAGYLGQFASPLLFGVALAPFGVRDVFAVAVGLSGIGPAAVVSPRRLSVGRPR